MGIRLRAIFIILYDSRSARNLDYMRSRFDNDIISTFIDCARSTFNKVCKVQYAEVAFVGVECFPLVIEGAGWFEFSKGVSQMVQSTKPTVCDV